MNPMTNMRTVLCCYCPAGIHQGEHRNQYTAQEIAVSKAQTCKENYFKALESNAIRTAREVAR